MCLAHLEQIITLRTVSCGLFGSRLNPQAQQYRVAQHVPATHASRNPWKCSSAVLKHTGHANASSHCCKLLISLM
jgi:hypothetical protein